VKELLAGVPDPGPPASDLDDEIAESVRYLASDAALRSLEADAYWPKWDSPWWHMLLLHELGEARHIPERVIRALVEALDALPIKIFPIRPEDSPPGADPHRDSQCHCALGNVVQVLAACGVDVEAALPWVKPWFPRYQMADGGLNCDASAYLVEDECPSSMVGTIAPFEAMQLGDRTTEKAAFLDRAAAFLVERRLSRGSPTRHNAEERDREAEWREPCFPRFYFYDVLRGASALARWASAAGHPLPRAAIAGVVEELVARFPDGVVRIGRRAWLGRGTLVRTAAGAWVREPQASTFPLLEAASAVGRACPTLTRQWTATRRALIDLADRGLVVD
jgi:hypothetical protein